MTLRKEGVRENGLRRLSVGVFSGDLTHIETQVASGDSTIDFTNVFSSDYDRYVIFVDNFVPQDDSNRIDARLSSDGGSTWDSGSSDYAYSAFQVTEGGTTFVSGSDSNSEILGFLFPTVGNDPSSNDTSGSSSVISDPADPNRATVVRNNSVIYRTAQTESQRASISGGIRLSQSSIDSIRMYPHNSGNISSGIFSVYGVDE